MEGELRDCFLTFRIKGDLSSLLLTNLTAAAISRRELHCRVFIHCNIDCSLKVEGKCTLLHECKVTESREKRSEGNRVDGEC